MICSYVMFGMIESELQRSCVINSLQKGVLFGSVKKPLLGSTMLRGIDKGFAKLCAGIV